MGGDASIYVVGDVQRSLPGQTWIGGYDAFVRKYDREGNEIWTRQFGTAGDDVAHFVKILHENVYVSAIWRHREEGRQAVLRKYSPDGREIWTRYWSSYDGSHFSVFAVDPLEAAYVAHYVDSAVSVCKYDASGNKGWEKTLARGCQARCSVG